jgi:TonB-linked SusC/RagA family outer membrane protein
MKTKKFLIRLLTKNNIVPYGAFIMVLFFALFLNAQNMYSQDKTITGIVKDDSGKPLPGASISVKGTTYGTGTDFDGKFSISVSNDATTLVVSYIGFTSQEVEIAGRTSIDVQLVADASTLDEIVVVGYGTQKKTSLTAAVSVAKGEDLQNVAVSNASSALVGRIPGLITRQTSGEIGQDNTQIFIRGVGTTGNSNPLIIVDGIPRTSLNEIDPSSIKSYTVLKDAAAVAPYGMGGANGVILVTTKSGNKSGKTQFKLNTNIGFQNPTIVPRYANSYEFARGFNEAENNVGIPIADRRYSAEDIDMFKRSNEGDRSVDGNLYPYLDPFDFILTPNAPISNTNWTATGGNEKVQYFTGLSYLYQQANFSTSKLDRVGLNTKIDLTPSDKTTITLSVNGFNQIQNGPSSSGRTVYISPKNIDPTTDAVYWSDGSLAKTSQGAIYDDIINAGDKTADRFKLLTSLSVEQELFEGFKVKGVFAYDYATTANKHWQEPESNYFNINLTTDPYTFDEVVSTGKHSLSQSQQTWKNYTYQGMISYVKQFNKHGISVLGVVEQRANNYNTFSASRNNYELPIDELNFGSADKDNQSNGGASNAGSQVGYVYRATYNYDEKYLFEAAGRYDGHYYFAPGQKYGFFPSFSVGWNISKEAFMEDTEWINNLKLRTSWGQSGNLAGGANQYSSSLILYGNSFPFGNSPTQGAYAQREGNPNITWERADKFNIGVDFNLFNGLLSGEVDYFNEKRDNMLLNPGSTVPQEYGIGLGQVNAGKMNNSGIEILLRGNKRLDNGLNIGVTGIFTYAQNELVEIFENPVTGDDPIRTRTGNPFGSYYGLVSEGLYQVSDDINGDGIINADDGFPESNLGGVVKPGSIRYVDTNKDGVIDMTDEQLIGSPVIPEIIYSFSADLKWKGFDLNVMFQGAENASTKIEGQFSNAWGNSGNFAAHVVNDSWTPETPNARFPALSPTGLNGNDNVLESTFNMIDAGYLRLKFAELGYTLPTAWTDSIGLSAVRVYTSGVNLFTWSDTLKYSIDAESTSLSQGTSTRGWYNPQQKTTSFGLNITF